MGNVGNLPDDDEILRRIGRTSNLRDAAAQVLGKPVDIDMLYGKDDTMVGGVSDGFRPLSSKVDNAEKSLRDANARVQHLDLGNGRSLLPDSSLLLDFIC